MSRKLSVRKGSATALDPHGFHAEINMNPSRSSSSTLSIVRVHQSTTTTLLNLNDPPASPQRRIHRRIGSLPSESPSTTNRVSFAFSSFSSNSSTNKDQPPSPSSSPRLRPSSPHNNRSASFSGKPRLTPDQLVDLARQATNPKTLLQPTPPIDLGDHAISHAVTPATFTPLPDDIYLPFIDRPSEVAALISSPPDLKLFTLLAQTFPNNKHPIITDPSIELPPDPIQWSYHHLIYHLTHIDRDIAPDPIWAIAARRCIHFHSELIWERIKGALGVPPELDIDCDFLQENTQSTSIADEALDRGGHWPDWDSIMDSPIDTKRLSLESPVVNKDGHDSPFIPMGDVRDQPTSGGATRPTLDRQSHFSPQPTITHQEATPLDNVGPDYLSIEPLLAPSSASASFSSLSNHPPPLSIPSSIATGGDGLGDIAEGAEEDETELVCNTESTGPVMGQAAGEGADDAHLISPIQIQGLKISTSPIPSSNSYGTPPMMLSPISPLPPYPPVGTTVGPPPPQPGFTSSLPHSRTSSFSSIGPFQRSESTGGLAASWSAAASGGNHASSVFTGSEAGDTRERDVGYLSDGDRLPGHPLFPSNFARLATGPTLRAK